MKKIVFFSILSLFYLSIVGTPVFGEVTWSVTPTTGSDRTLTISGTGPMEDYSSEGAPWYGQRSKIKTIIIEYGVTHVGKYAFQETATTSISIPVSVTSFGEGAFKSCANKSVYYAGSPNEWADIDFEVTGTYAYSHPFYGGTSSEHHMYFYNQTSTETTRIVFSEGLTTVKAYTFYYAGNISEVYIPQSVSYIGTKAFHHCGNLTRIIVLNTSAPNAETNAFEGINSTSYLYVPSGANGSTSSPGFKRLPWYDSTSSGKGAKYIGATGTDKTYTTTGNNFGTGKVYPLSGSVTNASWTLSLEGVLTITGSGTLLGTYVGDSFDNDNILPWARFRRLVNTVIIRQSAGDITSLGNIIKFCYAIEKIIINQNTVPTGDYTVRNDFKKSTDCVTLSVNPDLLLTAKSNAPWNSDRIRLALNDKIVVGDASNNDALLTALHNLAEPFTVELSRSLSSSYYNTFCSPVPMSAAEVTSVFGAGVNLYELDNTEYDAAADEFTLNFVARTAIEPGHPYLIKPAADVSNPTIASVEPSSVVSAADNSFDVTGGHITSHGILSPYTPEAEEYGENFLFLMADNKLRWAASGTLKGMRAFFKVTPGAPALLPKARTVMRFPNVATGVDEVIELRDESRESSVENRKILRDGQLLIVRDGKTYNAQGQVID